MRTILIGFRVADAARSVRFYAELGYEVVGEVPGSPIGGLTMLKLPDEEFVSLELVAAGADGAIGTGLDHIAIQVDELDAVRARLRGAGIPTGAVETPGGPDGPRTCALTDPDGYTIELTEWPAGHPVGMTADDFAGA